MARDPILQTSALGSKRPGGVIPALTLSVTDGLWMTPGTKFYLVCRNAGTGTFNIRLLRTATSKYNRIVAPTDIAVPASGIVMSGALPRDGFVQPDGTIYVDFPDGASINISLAVIAV